MPEKHILLATLGGQPQIVTFTLDLLLPTYPISDVIVLHPATTQERIQNSLKRVQGEFAGDYYASAQRNIHLRSHVLQFQGKALHDIYDDRAADGVLDTLHKLIGDLKRQGYAIHLSATGGRRLMGLLAVSVATLNFDRHDHIWHIYTPDSVKKLADEGTLMHVPADTGVTLIQAPFLSLGAYVYYPSPSFRNAQEEQRSQMDALEYARCSQVFQEATPAQQKILRAFGQGLRPQQIAEQFTITIATVYAHTSVLLRSCYNAWNIDMKERLGYQFLQVKFTPYFERLQK